MACAVYLSNRSPTRSVQEKTPQEAWSGRKPSISHLRVFGSIAYVHVPDERREKLDDKSERFIFIGYDSSSKGYKQYNPNKKKTVVNWDVVFDEEGQWDFETHEKEYNFFPPLEEEKTPQHVQQELTPSTSTTHKDTLPSPKCERAMSHTRCSINSRWILASQLEHRLSAKLSYQSSTKQERWMLQSSRVWWVVYDLMCTRLDILYATGLIS